MSVKEPFFPNNTFQPFGEGLGASNISPFLTSHGAKFLSIDEANSLNHSAFFDLVITHQATWNQIDALPRISSVRSHTLVPFAFDDHEEIRFEATTLLAMFESEINNALVSRKFIVSCDPRHFVAVEFNDFGYDLVSVLAQNGGANTHFIIFDESRTFAAFFCSEFPFVIISHHKTTSDFHLFGKTNKYWQDYFAQNIDQAVRNCAPEFVQFVNQTYIPRLLGYQAIPSQH